MSTVVFPAPRKPVRTSSGTRGATPIVYHRNAVPSVLDRLRAKNLHQWLPDYGRHLVRRARAARPDGLRHVLFALCDQLAAEEQVTIERRSLARFEPVDFDPAMIGLVERTAVRLGHTVRRMPSGAGHDAQWLARKLPAAMMFVPSIAGISHHWSENTSDDDLVLGAQVFTDGIAEALRG